MTRTKSLQYAYPSSPFANRHNCGKGCWFLDDGSGLPEMIYQEHEKWEALEHFQMIPATPTSYSFTIESATFRPTTF